MVGVCLIAVFAIAAVAASSASALPEWGKCVEQAGGKYLDGNCTTKGKGGTFEWKKGATQKNVKFTGKNVGSGGVLTTLPRVCVYEGSGHQLTRAKCAEEGGPEAESTNTSPITIECESETNTGEQVGKNKVANISVKFLGCKVFGSAPCSNGPNEGEITVNTLKGELGYINKASKEVGVLLQPVTKKGEFAKFNCAGILGTVVGVGNSKDGAQYLPESKGGNDGIISPITPVNTMTSNFTQVFTVNAELAQNIPSKFENKPFKVLESYTFNIEEPQKKSQWSAAGEEITNENTAAEEGEIKA